MNNSWLWKGRPWKAFKTVALLFSFAMNLVLLIVLLAAAPLIIPIVAEIASPIVGELNSSFVDMNSASIQRVIQVNDTLDIEFVLPVEAETTVVVNEEVPLTGVPARFVLPDGGGSINGLVYLSLPEGLSLPVELKLDVPVKNTIPVKLDVAVDIPLSETELGQPFDRLQGLFAPLDDLLKGLPSSNAELLDRLLENRDTASPEVEAVTAK